MQLCGSVDNVANKVIPAPAPLAEQPTISESEAGSKPPKVNRLKIFTTIKTDDVKVELPPPTDPSREQPRQKVIIKHPKQVSILDHGGFDGSFDTGSRKIKKIVDLTAPATYVRQDVNPFVGEGSRGRARESRRALEEEKRRNDEKLREEEMARRNYMEEMRMLEEQDQLAPLRRFQEDLRIEREEEERQKAQKKKKKKKRDEFVEDDYVEDYQLRRNSRGIPERDRSAKKKSVVEPVRYATEYMAPTKRRRGGEVHYFFRVSAVQF